MSSGVFIASTGQHVGKTTTCLGLLSGLRKRFSKIGFIKPVGQEHVITTEGAHADKDVVLFKDHFSLPEGYETMSPVLFPRGFTREYLDGKWNLKDLKKKIADSYQAIRKEADFVLAEGTGHIGVGSIVNLNNAEVAKLLGLKCVIIASGGLGSSFDALALNKLCCDLQGVEVAGVILNRVLPDKREMILNYMGKALKRWNLPILGCIPFDPFLSNPSLNDFESLFRTTLLSGEERRLSHYRHTRLISTSAGDFAKMIVPSTLLITSATRDDILRITLKKFKEYQKRGEELDVAIILTGRTEPNEKMVGKLREASIPMLYAPLPSYKVTKMITSYTVKIRIEDKEKIHEAIELVENHIDFERIIKAV
ncbi:MAG: AAA family ATPase [Candidatus Algichlamydia australiensis]|nr:AAA family ATPase [Chlamydiales bacterium]